MLCYWVGLMFDQSHKHPDTQVREDADDLVALLTPIVKAFITDNAFDGTNLAMRVFGGHGFIKEWGVAQYVGDARLNQTGRATCREGVRQYVSSLVVAVSITKKHKTTTEAT